MSAQERAKAQSGDRESAEARSGDRGSAEPRSGDRGTIVRARERDEDTEAGPVGPPRPADQEYAVAERFVADTALNPLGTRDDPTARASQSI